MSVIIVFPDGTDCCTNWRLLAEYEWIQSITLFPLSDQCLFVELVETRRS
jgi:hypothetical protein